MRFAWGVVIVFVVSCSASPCMAQRGGPSPERFFRMLDSDGDGTIRGSEWDRIPRMRGMLEDMEIDPDRGVQLEEFESLSGEMMQRMRDRGGPGGRGRRVRTVVVTRDVIAAIPGVARRNQSRAAGDVILDVVETGRRVIVIRMTKTTGTRSDAVLAVVARASSDSTMKIDRRGGRRRGRQDSDETKRSNRRQDSGEEQKPRVTLSLPAE